MDNLRDRILSKSRVGLAGEFLDSVEPTTEADSLGILIIFLNFFAAMVGANVYLEHGDIHIRANLFALIVGESATARKNSTLKCVNDFFNRVDSQFFIDSVRTGLSSAEGVINTLKKFNEMGNCNLLAVQSEASAVFKNFERTGNKLSELIREVFDGDPIANMSIANEMRVENYYVNLIFLITKSELLQTIKSVQMLNGFANRFVWVLVHRSKILPKPPKADKAKMEYLASKVSESVKFGRSQTIVKLSPEAEALWETIYFKYHRKRPDTHTSGLKGRFDVLTLKLALNFALLDQSNRIEVKHLEAAHEIIAISEGCIELIFEKKSTTADDPTSKILLGLEKCNDWVSKSKITSQFFSNNINADLLNESLKKLEAANVIERKVIEGSGNKPVTLWRVASPISGANNG